MGKNEHYRIVKRHKGPGGPRPGSGRKPEGKRTRSWRVTEAEIELIDRVLAEYRETAPSFLARMAAQGIVIQQDQEDPGALEVEGQMTPKQRNSVIDWKPRLIAYFEGR